VGDQWYVSPDQASAVALVQDGTVREWRLYQSESMQVLTAPDQNAFTNYNPPYLYRVNQRPTWQMGIFAITVERYLVSGGTIQYQGNITLNYTDQANVNLNAGMPLVLP
jgi:hypothetical protein